METTIDEDDIDFKEFRELFLFATPQLQLDPQLEYNDKLEGGGYSDELELVVQLGGWIKAHGGYIPSCVAIEPTEARMASAYARYKHAYARNNITAQVSYLLAASGDDIFSRRSYRWYQKQ